MKNWLLLLCAMIFCLSAGAQTLEGVVTDEEGKVVEGATVYIRETAQGAVVNETGNFRIELPVGVYTCEISSLSYEKQIVQVEVKKGTPLLTIRLKPTVYMLKEVKVTDKGEDPAYYIMRNAIGRAPFHRHQVKSYMSEVYTKGTMHLDKMPKLLMLSSEVRKEVTPYIGKVFLLESVMDVTFVAPDNYEKHIVAFSSTIPDDLDPGDALGIITASIYDPQVMGMISPLSPGAFSYYRFRFAECYMEGDRTINKIRVEPRKQNNQLVDGWIYIAENDWSVVGFDFSTKVMGIMLDIKGIFHEVEPTVFLPTSYDIGVNVNVFGVRAGGKYYASVKYKEVEAEKKVVEMAGNVNLVSAVSKELPKVAKSAKREKAERQLAALAAKEELTTRDAYRMARLSQQLLVPEDRDTIPPLEIREVSRTEKVTVDSMAIRRDSSYWLHMRTIPLKKEEVVSYQKKDSLWEVVKRIKGESDTSSRYAGKGITSRIIMGDSFKLGQNVWLNIDGLIGAVPEYNFVDGFWIGQRFGLDVRMKKGRRLKIKPALYYATARKTLMWQVEGAFRYAPARRAYLEIGLGDVSRDFKRTNGAWRLENSGTSLVRAYNFMKFYRARYVNLQNTIDVANGLALTVGGFYEKRNVLVNHISYNFYKKDPKPNTPSSEGGVDMPDNTTLAFFAQLSYTPRLYYRMSKGYKEYVHSNWPTFALRYEKGVPNEASRNSVYDRLDIGIQQKIKLGLFDRVSYLAQAGKFLNKKELYFPDYKQFSTVGWALSPDVFFSSFCVADYYELWGNDYWLQGALNYTSSYLLLKRLPFMQRFLFDEAVHGRYVWTPGIKSYVECGYSIGFGEDLRAGVFVGFDRSGYKGIGVRLGIPVKWFNKW